MSGPVSDPAPAQESRDQATIRALNDINPALAGMFQRGRRLCGEPDAPDLANMIGHVGRELTNGLLRDLNPGAVGSEDRPSAATEESESTQRDKIARAFNLASDDPRVGLWSNVHKRLVGATHVGTQPRDPAPVRKAFEDLAQLLYGAFGEHFHTQADLDSIADTGAPDDVTVDRLKMLLLRPIQRRRFFQRLNNAAWVSPLAQAGFFRYPPPRRFFEDGRWQVGEWPEGQYLARMAPSDPAAVVSVFKTVPTTNDNPAIWYHLASAIEGLPVDRGASLVSRLVDALKQETAFAFSHEALGAAKALAKGGADEAFSLLKALLTPRPLDIPPQKAASSEEYAAQLKDFRRPYSWNDKWVLRRLEDYTFEKVLTDLVPALQVADGKRTFTVLLNRLHSIAQTVAEADARVAHALEQAESVVADAEIDIDDFDLDSRRWCRSLRHDDHNQSVRGRLARAAFNSALIWIGQPRSADAIERALEVLHDRNDEISRRMIIALIGEAHSLNPALVRELDKLLTSPDVLDPAFSAAEVAPTLRSQFFAASPAAQGAFLDRLSAGPPADYITWLLEFREEDATDPKNRQEIIEDWQRLRLRWFHDRIPEILRPLANRLGRVGVVPDARTQALDETGSWGSVMSSAAPSKSPVQSDDLRVMEPEDVVQYLRTWKPTGEAADPYEGPSYQGLETQVRSFAAEYSDAVPDVLTVVMARDLPSRYVKTFADGLKGAVQQNKTVAGPLLLKFARHTWQVGEAKLTDSAADGPPARWIGDSAVDLFSELIQKDGLSSEDRETGWQLLNAFVASELTWTADVAEIRTSTFRSASHASYSALGARVIEAAITLAWGEFMTTHEGADWPPPASSVPGDRLVALLNVVLAKGDQAGTAAEGALGHRIGQLFWLAYDWTSSHLNRLFDRGIEDPVARPAWATYIERHNLTVPAFPLIRPWYAEHARALPGNGRPLPTDPDDAVTEAFTRHVGWAALYGKCKAGESDRILENTFDRTSAKAKGHFYWSVTSWLSKAKDVRPEIVESLISFWDSRIAALVAQKPSVDRDEDIDSLCQLIGVSQIPADEAIRLARATTQLLRGKQRVTTMVWDGLERLLVQDPRGAFPIVENLANAVLAGEFPYLPFDEVAPLIRLGHSAGGETQRQALSLLHRIGGTGLGEYTALWVELGGST